MLDEMETEPGRRNWSVLEPVNVGSTLGGSEDLQWDALCILDDRHL